MNKILKLITIILVILNLCAGFNLIAHKNKDINKTVNSFYFCDDETQFHKCNNKSKLFVKQSAKHSILTSFIKPYQESSVVKYEILSNDYDENTIIIHAIIVLDHNIRQEVLDVWEYKKGYIVSFNRSNMEGV